jgi:putative Mg2+ transporter-C (MgtC) family protein
MLNDIYIQICSSEINTIGAIYKLFISLTLGAVIGFERRQKGQVAGMRTFALISMGATLAMLVSIYIPQEYMGLKNGDPGRIAAQVISGIGFLGAGAIIQMKGSVRGLTTAAGIWMTACIGLAVGAGMYIIATSACFLIIAILKAFEYFEKIFLKGREQNVIRLKVGRIVKDSGIYHECFNKYGVHLSYEYLRYDYTDNFTTFNFIVRTNDKTDFVNLFHDMHSLGDVMSLTLTNEVNN